MDENEGLTGCFGAEYSDSFKKCMEDARGVLEAAGFLPGRAVYVLRDCQNEYKRYLEKTVISEVALVVRDNDTLDFMFIDGEDNVYFTGDIDSILFADGHKAVTKL